MPASCISLASVASRNALSCRIARSIVCSPPVYFSCGYTHLTKREALPFLLPHEVDTRDAIRQNVDFEHDLVEVVRESILHLLPEQVEGPGNSEHLRWVQQMLMVPEMGELESNARKLGRVQVGVQGDCLLAQEPMADPGMPVGGPVAEDVN